MNTITRLALAHLQGAGYRVFPPPRAPSPDTTWTPRRSKAGRRYVLFAEGSTVTYRGDEPATTISLAAWHGWRRRTRARAG